MASSSSDVPKAAAIQAQSFPDGTTDFKPMRSKTYNINKTHISDTPMTWGNWYKHIDWLNTTFTLLIPLTGLGLTYWVPLQWKTLLWAVIYYFNTGIGITGGLYSAEPQHSQPS
jgi:stearoyl-CoA desaturase (Delta-9 desaturase)